MTCTDAHWHTIISEFNRLTTDVIRVPIASLNNVVACHVEDHPDFKPATLIARQPRSGSFTVEVRRDALFELIRSHSR